MFIYNKENHYLLNAAEIIDVFQGRDKGVVAVGLKNGKINKLAIYDSDEMAEEAVNILANTIRVDGNKPLIIMPDSETIAIRLRERETKYRLPGGKKPNRYGGS